ncbi:MAG: class I SAM-dependent methyltransferase, partial [Candidatus Omnitrophica bacterium]|nr:class I SAM-dependent methyltransferase [Candidatus Omnitrophota bacterium]
AYIKAQGTDGFIAELKKKGSGAFLNLQNATEENKEMVLEQYTRTFVDNLSQYIDGFESSALINKTTDKAVLRTTAIELPQGAVIKTSLALGQMTQVRASKDPVRVINTTVGQVALANPEPWTVTETSLTAIDPYYQIEQKIRSLVAERAQSDNPNAPIKILDWGAGQGTLLKDLRQRLDQDGIQNVQLIGYADQYYSGWENAPQGVEFIFDTADRLPEYFEAGEIDFIYSHKGLYHLTKNVDKADAVNYMSKVNTMLKPQGELRTGLARQVSQADMALSGFQFVKQVDITGVNPKMYFVKSDAVTLPSQTDFRKDAARLTLSNVIQPDGTRIERAQDMNTGLISNARIQPAGYQGRAFETIEFLPMQQPEYYNDADTIKLMQAGMTRFDAVNTVRELREPQFGLDSRRIDSAKLVNVPAQIDFSIDNARVVYDGLTRMEFKGDTLVRTLTADDPTRDWGQEMIELHSVQQAADSRSPETKAAITEVFNAIEAYKGQSPQVFRQVAAERVQR